MLSYSRAYDFSQMTTAIAVEDVRREVKILKALSGHKNLIKFHDAFEDVNNVYIVMEYVLFLFFCFLSFFIFIDHTRNIFNTYMIISISGYLVTVLKVMRVIKFSSGQPV